MPWRYTRSRQFYWTRGGDITYNLSGPLQDRPTTIAVICPIARSLRAFQVLAPRTKLLQTHEILHVCFRLQNTSYFGNFKIVNHLQ